MYVFSGANVEHSKRRSPSLTKAAALRFNSCVLLYILQLLPEETSKNTVLWFSVLTVLHSEREGASAWKLKPRPKSEIFFRIEIRSAKRPLHSILLPC